MFKNKVFVIAALVLLASLILLTGCPWFSKGIATCIDFNSLTTGTTYNVGDSISLNGVDMVVLPFEWSNGTPTVGGYAEVSNNLAAGGSGLDIMLNNVCLGFNFQGDIVKLTLKFGYYGGNINAETQSHFVNQPDFTGLSFPGFTVNVTNPSGVGDIIIEGGTMTPTPFTLDKGAGDFNFIIGGQELFIDDVCSDV